MLLEKASHNIEDVSTYYRIIKSRILSFSMRFIVIEISSKFKRIQKDNKNITGKRAKGRRYGSKSDRLKIQTNTV